jgi:hypothetical protein
MITADALLTSADVIACWKVYIKRVLHVQFGLVLFCFYYMLPVVANKYLYEHRSFNVVKLRPARTNK